MAAHYDVEVKEITASDFLTLERDSFNHLSRTVDNYFVQWVQRKLRNLDYKDEELDELANDILYDGLEIYENTTEQGEDVRAINSIGDARASLKDRAFLMLYAPQGASPSRPLDYSHDVDARKKQYESFCSIYPGIQTNPDKNPTHIEQVDSYQDMKSKIDAFVANYKGTTKKMVIIFNGHGGPFGLSLSQEPLEVNLDLVINDIKALVSFGGAGWDQGDGPDIPLPEAVDIVFAQCYSHHFTQSPQDGIFEVIPLTTTQKPKSKFRVKWKKTKEGLKAVRESAHEELNAYGRSVYDKEAKKDESNLGSGDTEIQYMDQ